MTSEGVYIEFAAPDFADAGIAQLVEHDLAKVGVASSSLVSRSIPFSYLVGFLLATVAASAGTGAEPGATPPGAYLFRNVRIWDGRSDAPYRGEVLVVGNKIQSVSHEGIAPAPELHPVVIDGGGRMLTPGFIDAHVHMSSVLTRHEAEEADPVYVAALEIRGAEQALLRGFTTQRDVAGAVFGLKRAIEAGYVVGPRIYAAGAALSQTAGHGDDRHYIDPPRRLGGGLTLDLAEDAGTGGGPTAPPDPRPGGARQPGRPAPPRPETRAR